MAEKRRRTGSNCTLYAKTGSNDNIRRVSLDADTVENIKYTTEALTTLCGVKLSLAVLVRMALHSLHMEIVRAAADLTKLKTEEDIDTSGRQFCEDVDKMKADFRRRAFQAAGKQDDGIGRK